jgi:hypothetical protein
MDKGYIKRKDKFGAFKTMTEYQHTYEKSGHSDKGKLPEGEANRII